MKKMVFAAILCLIMTVPAWAEDKVAVARTSASGGKAQECPMRKDNSVNINFNANETDISKLSAMMDAKANEVKTIAKDSGVTEIEMQNMNYSVNTSGGGGNCNQGEAPKIYQVYGNLSFKFQPEEKAAGFLAALDKAGYNFSMNSSMYRQCGADGGFVGD